MKQIFSRWILPVFLPLLLLGGIRIACLPDLHENSTDVYWHIHAADRSVPQMIAKHYPITLSVWRDHFADKELLFHGLLKLYTGAKHFLHSPLRPPFHAASILLIFLFLLSFVHTANKLHFSWKITLLLTLGTALFTPVFSYRLLMIRPHVFSMALMMLAYAILLDGPAKGKTALKMFFLGWLYAWSYSTPHLVTAAAFVFGIAWFQKDGVRAFFSAGASLLGIFCGFLIHPQFPNTFYLWKLQGFDALLNPVTRGGETAIFAKELMPPAFLWLLLMLPVLVLLYFGLMMWNRMREKNTLSGIPPEATALLLLSCLWCGSTYLISIRPVEYAIPSVFLMFGVLLRETVLQKNFRFCETPVRPWTFLSCCILLGVAGSSYYICSVLKYHTTAAPVELVSVMKKEIPPGTRVVNLDWSDFPPMAFLAPEYEYTWGLDPMFTLTPFPKESKTLRRLYRPGIYSSAMIGNLLQADYAVMPDCRRGLGRHLQKECGWQTVYDGKDGWIFRLSRTGTGEIGRRSAE